MFPLIGFRVKLKIHARKARGSRPAVSGFLTYSGIPLKLPADQYNSGKLREISDCQEKF